MDFNTTVDIIIKDLREVREIIDDFKNYSGVPQLQVELAKSKCKNAEDIIALLKTYRPGKPEELGERAEPVSISEKIEKKHKESLIEISEDFHREDVSDKKDRHIEDGVGETPKKPKQKKRETNIVADKFSHRSNIFNEQLVSLKNEEGISDVLKTKPVGNLNDAIGVNDKFLFIREIFGGNQTSYDDAIYRLNNAGNLSDAKAIIMSYAGEGDENEAVKQLLDLVKRKLPPDE